MKKLTLALLFGLLVPACGEMPVDSSGQPLGTEACTDVGAAQNCTYDDAHNGPSSTVTCQSNHDGVIVPVVGCTIALEAAPGVPYTATCVASCQTDNGHG